MENDGNMEFVHVEEKGIGLNIIWCKRESIMDIKNFESKVVRK